MDVNFDDIEVKYKRMIWHENAYYPFGMAIAPLDKEGVPDHRFTYNGKELEEETGYLDYQARQQDPQTGRFTEVDALAEKAPSWTPYRYGFNNPIKFIDPDGNFEYEALRKQGKYKHLVAYLDNIQTTYNNKPKEFKAAFKEYSQLTDEQVADMLTPGKGPQIKVAAVNGENGHIESKLKLDSNGEPMFDTKSGKPLVEMTGGIVLSEKMVDLFEKAGNKMNLLDRQGTEVYLESTLFHEATHYGDVSDGTSDKTDLTVTIKKDANGSFTSYSYSYATSSLGSSNEGGQDFEKQAYTLNIKNFMHARGVAKYSKYSKWKPSYFKK